MNGGGCTAVVVGLGGSNETSYMRKRLSNQNIHVAIPSSTVV